MTENNYELTPEDLAIIEEYERELYEENRKRCQQCDACEICDELE